MKRLATFASMAVAMALPAVADSSIGSSASDSLSRSSGSISDSITGSSHASSPDNRQAKGDYRVIDVAAVADRPDMVRLRLEPVVVAGVEANVDARATAVVGPDTLADDQLFLLLPREAADHGHVGKDAIVTALQRPYGIEFASGRPHAAFFLALSDDWIRDLKSAPLSL